MKRAIRNQLVKARSRLPTKAWIRLEDIALLSRVERTLAHLRRDPGTVVSTRDDVYALLAALIRDETVTYLEFGVHQGRSLRYFVGCNHHPRSEFHAFDSFQGLPEDWNALNPVGTFDQAGQPPDIDDPRVTFHIGWFHDTLIDFAPRRDHRLVVNVDCDLYSSTVTVLDAIGPHLREGDLVYFDEFADVDHEYRAYGEFVGTTGTTFALVGRSSTWHHVLLRVEPK